MPTRKNNETKEFAIGTKIEYDGKLYEVVEQKFCNECSIAHICPTNDVVKHTDYSNLLSRDDRVKIFGECSPVKRKDDKSVIFKEVSDENVYDVEALYKNDKELLPIRINIPSGYVIDIDNSDLANNIIKFKRKWSTLEQLYKNYKNRAYHFVHRDSIKDFSNNKLVAIANLMDIASYFNRGWNYDVNQDDVGYLISYDRSIKEPCYNIHEIDSTIDVYYGNPVFKNKADAKYVIDNPNFRDILDNIFKV